MVDNNDFRLRKQREEVLLKVGYIGRVFGSGEDAKTNYMGFTLIILVALAGISLLLGMEDVFHVLSPFVGAAFTYFVKK